MSCTTAVGFLLISQALLCLDWKSNGGRNLSAALGLLAGVMGLLPFAGYLYGVELLYAFGPFTPTAAHAALCFMMLAVGILCARSGHGAFQVLAEGLGGALFRRLMPVAIGMPILIGWFQLIGERAGFYRSELGLALFAIGNVVVFSILIWLTAIWLNRTDDVVREGERRYRELIESLPQLVWTCNAEGLCDYLGPQWVTYTGIPAAGQLGYGWLEQIHPDDRERTITSWKATAGIGLPLDIEYRLRRHDGVYRWFKTQAKALRDATGRLVKWFGTNTDIDDLRQVEMVVRENESLAHLAMEAGQVGIWKWDLRTNRVHWDRQMFSIYGMPATVEGSIDYADWSQTVVSEELALQEEVMKDTILRRGQSTREFRIRRRSDGAVRILQTVEVIRLNESGDAEWLVGTSLNISKQKLVEQELRESLREVGNLRAALDEHAIVAITDARGRITFVNDKFCAISQYTREELLGQDHRLINSGFHP
jgi:PAS domain S-box-containing protein